MLNSIAYAATITDVPYAQRWPRICLIGDPYQLPPNTQTRVPPAFNYTKNLSLLERLTPECSPYLRGNNKIRTVLLNIQYRMAHAICNSANIISRRTVRTRLVHPAQHQLGGVPYAADTPPFHNGLITDMNVDDMFRPVVWIDPYHNDANITDEFVRDFLHDAGDDCWLERSPLEAYAISHVLEQMTNRVQPDRVFHNLRILSPYNRMCTALSAVLGGDFPDYNRDGHNLFADITGTCLLYTSPSPRDS